MGLPAPLVANNAQAGSSCRRVPQVPFFPTVGNSIWDRKDNNNRDPVLGLCQETVQFMETYPGTGTVRMGKKYESRFIRGKLNNGVCWEKRHRWRKFHRSELLLSQDQESCPNQRNPENTGSSEKNVRAIDTISSFDGA